MDFHLPSSLSYFAKATKEPTTTRQVAGMTGDKPHHTRGQKICWKCLYFYDPAMVMAGLTDKEN